MSSAQALLNFTFTYGVHHGNENGDMIMTISSWRRQLLVSFESFDHFGGNWEWLQEGTMVFHGRWTYFEANSCDGGEESFQDEACDSDDDDDDDDDHYYDDGAGEEDK